MHTASLVLTKCWPPWEYIGNEHIVCCHAHVRVLPSTPCVKWPRLEKGRKVRCWLGGQLLFFWGYFSCFINPYMSDGKWRGGCRGSLSCRAAEWACGGMTPGATTLLGSFRHFRIHVEIHVFPTHGTFLWLQEYSIGNSNNVEFSKS